MRWKQFFLPVKSMSAKKAKQFISENPPSDLTILDVRQPVEYESGHIPGSKLLPIGDLGYRLTELDPEKPTLVYCAVGGRSRVAAQMLGRKGFNDVINLKGGFRAWKGAKAFFDEEKGLELFGEMTSLEQTFFVAYAMEDGLREFYLSITREIENTAVKEMFQHLSQIEIKHQERIFKQYVQMSGETITREDFVAQRVGPAVEGGLTTDEYITFFKADRSSVQGVIGLAMSIEAQALDLYSRASEKADDADTKRFLSQIADEEQHHLHQLGQLMDSVMGQGV